jgi:outer membrane immunogenic protein
MKNLLLASIAMITMTVSASAADLALRYAKAPLSPVAAVHDWSGFYVGAHLGYGWGHDDVTAYVRTTGNLFTTFDFNQSGILGGGQIGYNFAATPNWLLGIEGDYSGADVSGTIDVTRAPGTARLDGTLDQLATVRARLGYTTGSLLLYGTGGFAWGHVKARNEQVQCFVQTCTLGATDLISQDRTGWAAGAGIEYAFMQNWSAKIEYIHVDFGTYRTTLSAVNRFDDDTLRVDLVRAGVNYHF